MGIIARDQLAILNHRINQQKMKKLFSSAVLVTLFFIGHAQLPEKPQDISPLLIGEKIPDAEVEGMDGKKIQTGTLFAKPTVLVFYRGGWCPFCNKQLSALGEQQAAIEKMGYQVIAISPDDAAHLNKSAADNKLDYTLLSDSKGLFAKEMGLAFKAPGNYKDMLLKSSSGLNTGFLPVPAVYIINATGEVEFMFVNPDYKKRLSSKLLLAALESIQPQPAM
jgi:peroxiredoxin